MSESLIENWGTALASGAVGAAALTGLHQLATLLSEDSPRMDVVGRRAIVRSIRAAGGTPPPPYSLQRWALAGDLLANSAYYSLVACGREPRVWARAMALGVAAGVGALVLPARLGLGDPPRSGRLPNKVMTISWYLAGALAAAGASRRLRSHAAA